MSWLDCIDRALAAKKINGKKADEARERYANLYKEARADGMGDIQAQDWAADQATKTIEAEKAAAKHRKLAQMRHSIDTWTVLNQGGPTKLKQNARAFFDLEPGATPGIVSFKDNVELNRGYYHKLLVGFIDKYSPKAGGLHMPKTGLENIIREIFTPGSTGDATAAAMAKAWKSATDFAVQRFKNAGGVLNSLEAWHLPQKQVRVKLYKREAEWINDHMGWLDWDKMRWPDGSRIGPADRERVLREVYYTLKTGGDNKIVPGSGGGRGRSVGNKFDAHRFLVYKDADAWLAMHDKYGEGSVFEVMMNHLDSMAHDTAFVQTFGPNPSVGVEQIANHMKKIAAEADKQQKTFPRTFGVIPTTFDAEADNAANNLRDTFKIISRDNRAPEQGASAIAAGLMGNLREMSQAAFLGSIIVWAPQDFANSIMVSRFARLPVWDTMRTYFRMLSPTSKADRQLLMRHGFVNEAQTRFAHSRVNITGLEPNSARIMRRLSDIIMRTSQTTVHTQAARFATAAQFVGGLADWRTLPFDKVPGRRVFEAHGITAADWDAMRQTPVTRLNGHEFLMPDDHANGELADKFMVMIQQEARMATIEGSVNAARVLRGTARQGTLVGEILNSGAMFRSFMLTAAHWHVGRGITMQTAAGRGAYIGGWLAAMMVAGAIGLQLQQVIKGNDPMKVFTPDFALRTVLASGGLSIFGDLFAGDLLGTGIDMGKLVAGPSLEFLADAANLTVGNIVQATKGADPHFEKEAVQMLQKWAPGTSLWYARRALQAWVWEALERWADPQAEMKFRREAARLHNQGRGTWWAPGEALPGRGPDLENMVR